MKRYPDAQEFECSNIQFSLHVNCSPEFFEPLKKIASVEVWPEDRTLSYETLKEKAAQADGLLCMLSDRIDATLIQQAAPRLKVISQMAVGYDNIAVAEATRLGIPVGHTPGVLTETTADLAFSLLMAAARRVVEGAEEVHSGVWRPWGPDVLTGYDVYGATLGIVGLGRIGQAVARRAKGFKIRVLYSSAHRKPEVEKELGIEYVPLKELLPVVDFLSLHTALTPETRRLIGREELALMKPTAILVNTARGGVVDSEALEWALSQGIIAGAGLDVYDPEPIQSDNPLLKMKNVVILPHIGSASKNTRHRMAEMTVENLVAGLQGLRLPYCANPEVYDSWQG
ncbi:MAG: 2-hydroxyacid dehydrogenase [Anaerolineaceae bacterium]